MGRMKSVGEGGPGGCAGAARGAAGRRRHLPAAALAAGCLFFLASCVVPGGPDADTYRAVAAVAGGGGGSPSVATAAATVLQTQAVLPPDTRGNDLVRMNQEVFTWTDKVYITIVSPDHNFDRNAIDTIGGMEYDQIQVSTREATLKNYKIVETGPNTGIFTGEVILIGFNHDADGNARTGAGSAGYDNPQRESGGSGPTSGYLAAGSDDAITVSFEYSEDRTVVGSALIRWNVGEIQWLDSSYPIDGTGVIRVIDQDMNLNPEAANSFAIDVWSDSDPGGISLTVVETHEATGIFEGTVYFTAGGDASGHRLRVAEGDTVTAEYEDNTLPRPHSTADELNVVATTTIGVTVPPLDRIYVADLKIVDVVGRELDGGPVAGQQAQVTAVLTNMQTQAQPFVYLVQVKNEAGVTVSLTWITSSLLGGQTLSAATSWMPDGSGTYDITAFVWESISAPVALSLPSEIRVVAN